MSSRNYGIPTGYRENEAHPLPPDPQSVPQSYQMGSYDTSYQRPAVQSPPRRPVERRPVGGSSYPASPPPQYQSRPQSIMSHQNSYGMAAGAGSAQALQDIDNLYSNRRSPSPDLGLQPQYSSYSAHRPTHSQSSIAPLTSHGADMPTSTTYSDRSGMPAPGMAGYGYGYDQSMPRGNAPHHRGDEYDGFVDPNDIADEGDDFEEAPHQRRSHWGAGAAAGAGIGAATGAATGMMNALRRDQSGNYDPVPGNRGGGGAEKSEWLKQQSSGNKRLKWIVGSIIAVVVIAAIVGIVVGVLLSKNGGSSTPDVPTSGSGFDLNSPQIQKVLNDKNLHKVFPGMDYTPLDAQYPDCLTNPPVQDAVTLDVAILSQLTPAIRLYGTDCNQTQMVLHAIDKLEMNDTVKVWLGVWLENNQTTNTRQLNQMYDILDTYPEDHFAGVIVGNEVLFREDMTLGQLGRQLTTVRSKLAAKGINLPVATSDLGDDWTAGLAQDSDIVMANVHPFFAGVTPQEAPGWTWDFWQNTDVPLASAGRGAYPKNIISETGWPTQGGNDCGTGKKCPTKTAGSIAGISELNDYMDGWVCQAMANQTAYFWFEAFDEPWKVIFNDAKTGDFWEPHWGLMDANRKLKDGVKIPDCGGKTINTPYF